MNLLRYHPHPVKIHRRPIVAVLTVFIIIRCTTIITISSSNRICLIYNVISQLLRPHKELLPPRLLVYLNHLYLYRLTSILLTLLLYQWHQLRQMFRRPMYKRLHLSHLDFPLQIMGKFCLVLKYVLIFRFVLICWDELV